MNSAVAVATIARQFGVRGEWAGVAGDRGSHRGGGGGGGGGGLDRTTVSSARRSVAHLRLVRGVRISCRLQLPAFIGPLEVGSLQNDCKVIDQLPPRGRPLVWSSLVLNIARSLLREGWRALGGAPQKVDEEILSGLGLLFLLLCRTTPFASLRHLPNH